MLSDEQKLCCVLRPDTLDCVLAGLFHAALSLAVVLYEGQRLSHALQRSVATMVISCVQKQLHDPLSARTNLPAAGVIFGQQLVAPGNLFLWTVT